MAVTSGAPAMLSNPAPAKRSSLWRQMVRTRYLWLLFLPGFILILIFNYGPMYGLQIAFKEYDLLKGVWGSPWVGLYQFETLFSSPVALRVIKNTLIISMLRLLIGFPAPIILALLINELKDGVFKRGTQTISYLPHFLSWIIIASLAGTMLSPSSGPVNAIIKLFGLKPIYFMVSPEWFRPVLIFTGIWKEVGWGSILYLAALSGIDPTLHEAAIVDGASRLQRIRYINIPSIGPVVAIVLILNMGFIMDAGFEQIFNMYNTRVYDVADIIDTYVYRVGLVSFEFSFGAAVGLFKSLTGLAMIIIVNYIISHIGEERHSLW